MGDELNTKLAVQFQLGQQDIHLPECLVPARLAFSIRLIWLPSEDGVCPSQLRIQPFAVMIFVHVARNEVVHGLPPRLVLPVLPILAEFLDHGHSLVDYSQRQVEDAVQY